MGGVCTCLNNGEDDQLKGSRRSNPYNFIFKFSWYLGNNINNVNNSGRRRRIWVSFEIDLRGD
jgi:hypothetical protein